MEFPRYGIHEVKGIERFGRAGPHTIEVTIISRVRELNQLLLLRILYSDSYSDFSSGKKKKYIPHRLSNMRAVLMVNRPSTHQCTSPSRSRDSGSADVSVWLSTLHGTRLGWADQPNGGEGDG